MPGLARPMGPASRRWRSAEEASHATTHVLPRDAATHTTTHTASPDRLYITEDPGEFVQRTSGPVDTHACSSHIFPVSLTGAPSIGMPPTRC